MRTLLRLPVFLSLVVGLGLGLAGCYEMELLEDPAVSESSSLPTGITTTGGASTTESGTTTTNGGTTTSNGGSSTTSTSNGGSSTTPNGGTTTTPVVPDTTTLPPATLRIVHAAFGQGPVDIWVDGQAPEADSPLAGLEFGESTGWLDLEAGTIDVAVAVAGTSDAADAFFSIDGFELAADSRQTLWAHGVAGGEGDEAFDIGVYDAADDAPAADAVDLKVAHAALSVGPVDLVDGEDAPLLADIAFGGSASLLLSEVTGIVPVGIDADATEGTDLRFLPDFAPFVGEELLVVAVGDLEDGEFGIQLLVVPQEGAPLLLTPEVPEPARIRLLHATATAPDVVLWINGERVDASALSTGEGTLLEGLPPGETELQLREDEPEGAVIWSDTVDLAEGGSYALWTWGLYDTFFGGPADIRTQWQDIGTVEPVAAGEILFGFFAGLVTTTGPALLDFRLDVGEAEGFIEVEGSGTLVFASSTLPSGSHELTAVREADVFEFDDTSYGPDTFDLGDVEGVVLVVLSGSSDGAAVGPAAGRVLLSLPDGSVLEATE